MAADAKYLTAPQVLERYSITAMTLHSWLKNADLNFPRPRYIQRRRYFLEAELIEWERQRARVAA